MAGFLARLSPAATTYTTLCTFPQDMVANIRLVNRDLVNSIAIRIAFSPTATAPAAPANADYIEAPDLIIPAGGVLEEIGMAVSAGEVCTIYTSAATLTARAYGR